LCAGLGGYGIARALVVVTLLFLTPVDVLSAKLVQHYGWEERTFQLVANDIPAVRRAEDIADIQTQLAGVQGITFVSNAALHRGEG
jgi:hypothetical protein